MLRTLCLAALSLPALLSAQTTKQTMAYTVDSTGAYEGDLYLPSAHPASGVTFPVVVLVHGGAWRSGSRHEMHELAMKLAARGYASFSIDYDKKKLSFPYSWSETRDAIRFVRLHAPQYNLDPTHVAVLGSSAGGQLAALAALEPTGPTTPMRTDTAHDDVPVQAALTLNGIYDMHVKSYLIRRYLGGTCGKVGAPLCDDASPDNHVNEHEVPFFVGHGDHDHLVPFRIATEFVDTLKAHGDAVTFFVAHGAGHNYWKHHQYEKENFEAMVTFLDANLKAK